MLNKDKIFLYSDRAIVTCLCLLIFCLPFAKAGVEAFAFIAIFLWICKRAVGYRSKALWGLFPDTGLNRALLIYTIANAVSVIFSARQDLFLRGFFGKELKFLLIYFMLVEVVSNKKRLSCVLIAVIASAALIIADAGVQYYTQFDFLRGYGILYHSFSASFDTASGFSAWLIVMIPIFLGLIALNLFRSWKIKILLWLAVIIQCIYLLKTFTRGAWIGCLIAVLFMAFYFIKKYTFRVKILCLTTSACLLMVVLYFPNFLEPQLKYDILTKLKFDQGINSRIKSISQITHGPNLERIRLWKESFRMIKDYPLTGCGLNNYSVVGRNYKSFDYGGTYPHNSYLQKTAEIGIFGLLAFLFVLFSFFKIGILHLSKHKNYLVLGLLAGILAFLVQAFFDTHFYTLQLVVLFWYMVGLTVAVINLELKDGRIY